MKNLKHYLFVSFILIFISFIMFLIHDLVFGQLENTIYYSFMNVCFIPINIVGLFFSDIGFTLLKIIAAGDDKIRYLGLDFNDLKGCNDKLSIHEHDIQFEMLDYPKLKELVIGGRDILSNLIVNENILEHEIFADLLMALMHLRDEILFIQHKEQLTHDDSVHIKSDLVRVYKALTVQWINYLSHLKHFYPYQYNGAIKFNPFAISN